jgi:hypothetical protein
MLNPVEHKILPFTVSLLRQKLPPIQVSAQFQNQGIVNIGMPGLIVRVNDNLLYFSAIDDHVHGVATALTHLVFKYISSC